MNQTCKQCGGGFEISAAEQKFYSQIGAKFGGKTLEMPLPTFCPDCRNQRRMMFRNDRSFYLRKCDKTGKQFVSIYQPDAPYKVFQQSEWYGDDWDPLDYGRDFDFERPFFEQFNELMHEVPRLGIDLVNCQNSDYCNYCGDDKNCYLDIAGEANEDCYFNLFVKYGRNVVDCTFVYSSELCYECINCYDCYACQYSSYLENCSDCLYCFDLKGCQNCLFSHGLRNKQYCIFNEQKTKEEYEEYLKNLKLGSFEQRKKIMDGWIKFRTENAIFKASFLTNCEDCSGENLKNCKNTHYSFNALNCEDCRYLYDVLDAKVCQDLNYSLYHPEFSYELISTLSMKRSAFCMASHYNNEVYYCDLTNNSNNLFGCIGLNHKEYCILNKQYAREEYEELVPRIIEHMIKTGEWGQFFPVELSPFAYNETVAAEYFELSKEQVLANGWRFHEDHKEKMYRGPEYEIPDDIADVDKEALKKILICEKSELPYKIIEQELKFYTKMTIPVPRRSPVQRHLDRNALRNLRRLFERECDKCGQKIKSTFASERAESVFCQSCYVKEVY